MDPIALNFRRWQRFNAAPYKSATHGNRYVNNYANGPAAPSYGTGDWRYAMIMPDGSYFGDSEGDDPDAVAFCHGCHTARADSDFLFFVPEKVRMP